MHLGGNALLCTIICIFIGNNLWTNSFSPSCFAWTPPWFREDFKNWIYSFESPHKSHFPNHSNWGKMFEIRNQKIGFVLKTRNGFKFRKFETDLVVQLLGSFHIRQFSLWKWVINTVRNSTSLHFSLHWYEYIFLTFSACF